MTKKIIDELKPNQKLKVDVAAYDTVEYIPKTPNQSEKIMQSPIKIENMITKFEDDYNWKFSKQDYTDCFNLLSHVNFYTFKYYAKKEECSCFKDAKKIYYFDKFLQSNIQKITLDIEMGIRTYVVDSLSLHYLNLESKDGYTAPNKIQAAQFYLNPELYYTETGKHKRTNSREKDILSILYMFQNTIEKNMDKGNVKKELNEYSAVSAWILFDLLTLGELSFFFGKLTTANKKIVANSLNSKNILKNELIKSDLLASWLNSIRYIRNKAAHGAKIYGEALNVPSKHHNDDKEYIDKIPGNQQNYLINVLFSCKRIIGCLDQYTQENWNRVLKDIDTEVRVQNLQFEKLGLNDNWLSYFLFTIENEMN